VDYFSRETNKENVDYPFSEIKVLGVDYEFRETNEKSVTW